MVYRRTLRREVACTGIGLHSGRPVRLRLRPAPAEHGIRFVRTDVGVEIPASLAHIGAQDHATTLQKDGVSIGTVEHLLAALLGLGVDDALVEVDGPEVPVLDGSAAPFVILLHEAGLRPLAAPRLHLKVCRPVEVVHGDEDGAARARRPLRDPLLDRIRPPAASAPGVLGPAHASRVHRPRRPGADLRLPARGGAAAQERPRPRRQPRERGGHRRDGRPQQQAPLRGRVRPAQGARRGGGPRSPRPPAPRPARGHEGRSRAARRGRAEARRDPRRLGARARRRRRVRAGGGRGVRAGGAAAPALQTAEA